MEVEEAPSEAPRSFPSVSAAPSTASSAIPSALPSAMPRASLSVNPSSSPSSSHCARVYRARRRVMDPVCHLAPGPVAAPAVNRVPLPVLSLLCRRVKDRVNLPVLFLV
jgi:hypothetical protein